MTDQYNGLLRFWSELRKRLIICLIAVSVIFCMLCSFANSLYTLLAMPLLQRLPVGQGLISTNIVAPFFVPFEFTLIVAIFLAVPVFLYQLWSFIAPALYKHERRFLWPLLFGSLILFYMGVAFSYFVIFPIIFNFLTQTAPKGVMVSPDISQYLDFALKLFFIFGSLFEVPVVTILFIWTGITTKEKLISFRPYIIVGAFIIGMLIGPPDVLSQTLLAFTLWLLFEVGLFFSRFFVK